MRHTLKHNVTHNSTHIKTHNVTQAVGKDLLESQRMDKKHCVLEQEILGHKSQVDSTLANGAQLVADKHFASNDINAKCDDLKAEWKALGDATKDRRKLIDLNLNVHQFFHDAAEVEGFGWSGTDRCMNILDE